MRASSAAGSGGSWTERCATFLIDGNQLSEKRDVAAGLLWRFSAYTLL